MESKAYHDVDMIYLTAHIYQQIYISLEYLF